MSQQQGGAAGDDETGTPAGVQWSAVGNDRVQVEFQMDDLIQRLLPGLSPDVGHCSGCNGCTGCKHVN
jgi:hypothetical protein